MRAIKDFRRVHFTEQIRNDEGHARRVKQLKALLEAGETVVYAERIAASLVADALTSVRF